MFLNRFVSSTHISERTKHAAPLLNVIGNTRLLGISNTGL